MLAGYETTAVVLSQCVYMLSKHPEAQQKLLHEVDGSKKQISYEDLGQFPFASAVLKEVLRLVGPLAFFSRINTKDTEVRLARQRMCTLLEHQHQRHSCKSLIVSHGLQCSLKLFCIMSVTSQAMMCVSISHESRKMHALSSRSMQCKRCHAVHCFCDSPRPI